jgi:PAS domain S-box-containing protein
MKVLIVDDKSDNLDFLQFILERNQIEPLPAINGKEALEILQKEKVDLIISDILMPVMDGFQLCRICKSDEKLHKIPFIFYTATYTGKEDEKFAYSLGADQFIRKPADPVVFIQLINKVVREAKAKGPENTLKPLVPKVSEKQFLGNYSNRLIERLENNLIKLEKAETKYLNQFNYISDFIFSVDENGYFLSVNNRAIDFGFQPNQLIGKHLTGFLTAEGKKIINNELYKIARLRVNRLSKFELEMVDGNKQTLFIELSLSAVYKKGDFVGLYGSIYDLSERKQAQLEIETLYRLNQNLIDAIPFGITIMDEDANVIFLNKAMTELSPSAAIGKKCWESCNPDFTEPCAHCPLEKQIEVGYADSLETDELFPGRIFIITHKGIEFKGKKALMNIYQDQTQIRQAQIREEISYQITNVSLSIDNLPALGKFVHLELSRIINTDHFFLALLNEEKGTFEIPYQANTDKKNSSSFAAEHSLAAYVLKKNKTIKLSEGEILELVDKGKIKVEGEIPLFWIGVPLVHHGNSMGVAVVQSFKGNHSVGAKEQDVLEYFAPHLSLVINHFTSQQKLQQTLERALESDRLKLSFLRNLSHEIRTPMNGILGFTSLLSSSKLKSEEKEKYSRMVQQSSQRMLNTINDLVDVAMITTGQIEVSKKAFELAPLLQLIYDQYQESAKQKKLEFELETVSIPSGFTMESDRDKIQKIISKLVDNAIKFTKQGKLKLKAEVQEQNLLIAVSDTGIGIPENRQTAIFDRFVQADIEDKDAY